MNFQNPFLATPKARSRSGPRPRRFRPTSGEAPPTIDPTSWLAALVVAKGMPQVKAIPSAVLMGTAPPHNWAEVPAAPPTPAAPPQGVMVDMQEVFPKRIGANEAAQAVRARQSAGSADVVGFPAA